MKSDFRSAYSIRCCLAVALAAGIMLGAGCGKEPTSNSSQPSAPSATNIAPNPVESPAKKSLTTADLKFIAKAKQNYKILLIVKTLNNPFFKPMVASFKSAAATLGVTAEVQAAPQETDVDKQAALVQNAAAQGFNAICITPADSKALVPALKAASEKGVLIINVDNRLDGPTVSAAGLSLGGYVGADNEAGGKLAGKTLVSALSGHGNVVIIEGIRGVDNAESRKRGFASAVEGKLTVVDAQSAEWMTEKAQGVMANMLAAHPDIAGVFCANDEMAIGAIKALKTAGKAGTVKVVSYDDIKEVQSYLVTGELIGTVEQHPDQMGEMSARLAVAILDKTMKPGGELLVDLSMVTGTKGK